MAAGANVCSPDKPTVGEQDPAPAPARAMPLPLSSFGGIDAVLRLAWQLRAALSDASGQSAKIRSLITDIDCFTLAVQQAKAAIDKRFPPLAPDVGNAIKHALITCHDVLRLILGRLNAFRARMTSSVSDAAWREYWAVAAWSILGGKDVDVQRMRLCEQMGVADPDHIYSVMRDITKYIRVGVPSFPDRDEAVRYYTQFNCPSFQILREQSDVMGGGRKHLQMDEAASRLAGASFPRVILPPIVEGGAPQPSSGPAPMSSHGGSRRLNKGKTPAYVPSNASTASGMGMDLPPTAALAAPRAKLRTNQFLKDTSIPRPQAPSASQQAPDAAFVYGLGGGGGFHFGVVGTSSREGTARNEDHAAAPRPLPPVPGSAPASAVEIRHSAVDRVAPSSKGKTLLALAIVGMRSSMTAGGPSSAGTRLSGASALSVLWADSPLGPPPSLVDSLSPGAKPEPVRPAVRSRWAPRSDAGSDDELCSAAAQPARSKTAAVQPKAHLRVSGLDSHYRLATPERTRFYDPPAMFTPPTSSPVDPDLDVAAQHDVDEVACLVVAQARDHERARPGGPRKLCASVGNTDLGVEDGRPPSRPPRPPPIKVEPPPPPAAVEPLILDLKAPALEQQPQPSPQEKARPKTRTLTMLWTELWQEVHSPQLASPPSPAVPALPTSLATAPTHEHTHALPAAAPARSSTVGSESPSQARNSTLSTLPNGPSLSAFPMRPSSQPAMPTTPAAALFSARHQHQHRAKQAVAGSAPVALPALPILNFGSPLSVPFGDSGGGMLALPALPSLNFGSPLSVSFGDSARSLFSAASDPPDFLSPASSMFASSPRRCGASARASQKFLPQRQSCTMV